MMNRLRTKIQQYFVKENAFLRYDPVSKPWGWIYVLSSLTLAIAALTIFIYRWNTSFVGDTYADEFLFIASFENLLAKGWWVNVANGSSPMFNLLAWPLYLLNNDIILSLRLLSLFSMFGAIAIWSYFFIWLVRPSIYLKITFVLFLTLLGTYRVTYYNGCNDPLFILFVSGAIITMFRGLASKNNQRAIIFFSVSGALMAMALGTRELFVYYVPGFISVGVISLFIRHDRLRQYVMYTVISFFMLTGIIHLPALVSKGTLSFQSKESPSSVLWVERFYLTVQRLNGGIIHDISERATVEQVAEYERIHGEDALPDTNLEAILKTPVLTIKNFFYVFVYAQLPFFRQIGVFYLLLFIGFVYGIYKKQLNFFTLSGIIFFLCYLCCFSITILEHVEFRWLMLFPFLLSTMAVYEFRRVVKQPAVFHCVYNINLIILSLLTIFKVGVW